MPAWDSTFEGVCRKAIRAVREVHVRGVKTNIAFILNILHDEVFRAGHCHTKYIDETPSLFELDEGQDRATKMLKYIGNIVVKEQGTQKLYDDPRFPPVTGNRPDGLKQLLDAKGPEAVAKWVLDQKKLLICDTTTRDAHQSLLATRVRTRDIIKGMVIRRVIYTLFYTTSGIMATPINVCAKFIVVFIIFGAFLERTGIANFFIQLANSVCGAAAGGPAKVAVISSALCGMADEPTGALDSHTGHDVLKFLQQLNRDGSTVILITHDNGIASTARRVVRLADGKKIEDHPQEVDWL